MNALLLLLLALPSPGRAASSTTASLYELGMEQRAKGDLAAAKETFLRLNRESPESVGAFEGLALCHLALGEYREAGEWLERWRVTSPSSTYVLSLQARAQSSLRQLGALMLTYTELSRLDPDDLRSRRGLDALLERTSSGAALEGRSYKSIVTENIGTASPQRIAYAGRSAGVRARARARERLAFLGRAEVRQESQKNDTGGFTYYDVLEQRYGVGLEARPDPDSRIEAEYGQSFLSDVKGAGVGRRNFSRARLAGDWHVRGLDLSLAAERAPRFLRGAGGSTFFALLRETSLVARAEGRAGPVGLRAQGGLRDHSEGTTFKSYDAAAFLEREDDYLQASFAHAQHEFFGAGTDGRLQYVSYERPAVWWRRRAEESYELSASYAHRFYRDANRLHEVSAGASAWLPWWRALSGGYRYDLSDYAASLGGYRSWDERGHWVFARCRRRALPGLWLGALYEHGFLKDFRGAYEANSWKGELEAYLRERVSLALEGGSWRSTLRDDSYSASLRARVSF